MMVMVHIGYDGVQRYRVHLDPGYKNGLESIASHLVVDLEV